MGFFIIFATAQHHYFEKRVKDFKVLMFLCEGVVPGIATWYYFNEGRKALPFVYLFAAFLYFVTAVVTYNKIKSRKAAQHIINPLPNAN
ncbi:MAG: hypothetical protein HYX40_04015 [Sphingobacteriales bacterium]|nr:hypothetical protein [Sphingobacteriales bacterium]